jgi:hypothetical protein
MPISSSNSSRRGALMLADCAAALRSRASRAGSGWLARCDGDE